MKSNKKIQNESPQRIATPETVIAAAALAPTLFDIGRYFPAILVMREKGHSWRAIAAWLVQFRIEISYVHLRRLFCAESTRRQGRSPAAARQMGVSDGGLGPAAGERDPGKVLTEFAGGGDATDDEAKWARL